MAKLYNLARMTTTTTGTGTITLGSAVAGYLTFAQAGVANGDVVDYAIKDGNDSEIGTGTYTSSGTTLTRTVTKSTNSNAALNLSGAAEVFITPRAETLNDASLLTTGIVPAIARIATGTADSFKFVRDDRTLVNPYSSRDATALGFTDWNSVVKPAVYDGLGLANAPNGNTGDWFYVEVLEYHGGTPYYAQIATGLTIQGRWVRNCISGTWGAWRRLDSRVLLNTLTTSGVSSIQDTTSITSEFYRYEVVVSDMLVNTSNAQMSFQAYISGAFQTSYSSAGMFSNGGFVGWAGGIPLSLGDNLQNSTTGVNAVVEFNNPLNTSQLKPLMARTVMMRSNGTTMNQFHAATYQGSTAAMTGFRIIVNSGTMTGVARVYGLV